LFFTPCYLCVNVMPSNIREKAVRSKCIISMLGNSMTIVDPKSFSNKKTFLFDYCYWSTDEYMENDQGVYMPDGPNSRYVGQVSPINLPQYKQS
uniref:Uncharacterized protein n=1 Tax=Callorhinchus milii TaxID=7868 RepID=A0A4W3JH30_CALMI